MKQMWLNLTDELKIFESENRLEGADIAASLPLPAFYTLNPVTLGQEPLQWSLVPGLLTELSQKTDYFTDIDKKLARLMEIVSCTATFQYAVQHDQIDFDEFCRMIDTEGHLYFQDFKEYVVTGVLNLSYDDLPDAVFKDWMRPYLKLLRWQRDEVDASWFTACGLQK